MPEIKEEETELIVLNQKPATHVTKRTRVRCLRPFTTLELQVNGEVSFCCKEWTHLAVIGNLKAHPILDVWNSETAQFIRKQMLEDKWETVCNADICPVLKSEDYKELDMEKLRDHPYPVTQTHLDEIAQGHVAMNSLPAYMLLANNDACNIKCPTCYPYRDIYKRNENANYLPEIQQAHQNIVKGPDADLSNRVADEILQDFMHLKVLRLSGAGDPFYRADTRKILFSKDKPNDLKIELLTNALLLTPEMWEKIKHNNISLIDVSVDAGTKQTYEEVRRLGKWDTLMRNLEFLGEKRREGAFPVFILNFTVTRQNFREIIPFTLLAREFGCDSVYFARVRGRIWRGENFFDGPDHDPDMVAELQEIKAAALNLNTPEFLVRFHNI